MWKYLIPIILLMLVASSGELPIVKADVPMSTILTGIWMFIILCLVTLISFNVEKIRDRAEGIQKGINGINSHDWEDLINRP